MRAEPINKPLNEPPPIDRDYAHIRRYWDRTRNVWMAKLLPGEFYVTHGGELMTTVLGSCVSACIYDLRRGIGGMNHFMLPHSDDYPPAVAGVAIDGATRYGSYAMERVINDLLKRGAVRETLEVKVFGGGQILASLSNVGLDNIRFVRRYIAIEKLRLCAEDLGGPHPRKLVFNPTTGRVQVKKLRVLHNDTIIRREITYMHTIEQHPIAGEAELF